MGIRPTQADRGRDRYLGRDLGPGPGLGLGLGLGLDHYHRLSRSHVDDRVVSRPTFLGRDAPAYANRVATTRFQVACGLPSET